MKKIIGIDLGTTNSLVTVWKEGQARLIPNSFGEFLTPSIVSVDDEGTVYVGNIAKERLISHPKDTVSVFKRAMGTSKTYLICGREYRAEELSALVLRRLKEDAENYLGEEVEEAVISVPAYFNDMARSATKNAGRLAGLKVERIINEPSAAALACQHIQKEEDATILVYDFGGGTLDVSLVDCFDNVIEIRAVSGDNHLGGSDFDQVIAEYFCNKNNMKFEEQPLEMQGILLESARKLKVELSDKEESTMVVVSEAFQGTMKLGRRELIQISEALFQRMIKPIQRVINDAKIGLEQISQVVLVGGSCKMPIVKQYLQHVLKLDCISEMNPDYMIALGVGTYAGIKERNSEIKDMLLTDICPFSLGTGIYNEADQSKPFMEIIIERNSPLPMSREVRLFTVRDQQTRVHIEVFQGEELYAKDNLSLGEMNINVPLAMAGAESITVRYTYDINGILVVDVKVDSTGETEQLVIVNKQNTITECEIKEKIIELEKLKVHPRDKEENQLLIARGERLFTQTTGEMREAVGSRMAYFSYLLEGQNELKINRWKRQLIIFVEELERYLLNKESSLDLHINFADWYEQKIETEEESDTREEYELWYDSYDEQLLQ